MDVPKATKVIAVTPGLIPSTQPKSSANSPLREIIKPSRFEVLDRFLELNIDTPEDIINLQEKLQLVNE